MGVVSGSGCKELTRIGGAQLAQDMRFGDGMHCTFFFKKGFDIGKSDDVYPTVMLLWLRSIIFTTVFSTVCHHSLQQI